MLSPGDRLGHYEIVSPIGAGGMGEVYKARDTRLDRPVALKVLNARARTDEDGKRRFAQEARTVSALNHPHIVTVYDIGSQDGIDFIAMEYVSGENLARRIDGKPMPVPRVLRYAGQIADALAAAHAGAIVHRDLKPANIMITERDEVKLLDFGLAKLGERTLSDEDATLTVLPQTMAGTLVGTAAYMSPEQVEEKPVGPEADVFAFGVVLYEMLTGARPFQGRSRIATMTAILHSEPPPVQDAAPDAPIELEHLVRLCLQKDPERRPREMKDVRTALEGIQIFSNSGVLSTARWQLIPPPRSRKPWWIGGAALAILASAALWYTGVLRRGSQSPVAREKVLTRLTSDPGFSGFPALSADGKLMAYASDRSGEGHLDIWVQQTEGGGEAIRLTNDDTDSYVPVFSPDGSKVAFRSEREGGGIYVVRSLGGQPRLLAANGRRPRFSPDGKWIAYWDGATGMGFVPGAAQVKLVPAEGGTPQAVRPDFALSAYPIWSADGSMLLFLGRRDSNVEPPVIDWWITPVGGGTPIATGAVGMLKARKLTPVPGDPAILPAVYSGDQVLFAAKLGDSTNVWDVTIPPNQGRVIGEPLRRTSGTNSEVQPTVSAGATVFASLTLTTGIWSVNWTGRGAAGLPGEMNRVTHGVSMDGYPSLTADGGRMVFISGRSGRPNVWLRDMRSGKETQLTAGTVSEMQPKISADGSTIAYAEDQPRPRKLQVVRAGAGGRFGTPQRLCEDCGIPTGVSRDGSLLLLEDGAARSPVLMDRRTGNRQQVLQAPDRWNIYAARFSNDGNWISFHSDLGRSGVRQIGVARLQPGLAPIPQAQWVAITDGKSMDREAVWGPGDNVLYFLSEREGFRCIWAQPLDPFTKQPRGAPFPVAHFHRISRSLGSMPGTVAAIALSVLPRQLVFALGEVSGNIWVQRDEGH
jgi:serine/threonine protein kinase/Tol biopolymer transport system component